jgi:hypothetical protein
MIPTQNCRLPSKWGFFTVFLCVQLDFGIFWQDIPGGNRQQSEADTQKIK